MNAHLGCNPRSQANSNALADFVIADLQHSCRAMATHLASEEIISTKNADVRTRVASRNVDLIFAEQRLGPGAVRASVENKTIMTAHGKARWNRYGDLIAYCNHVHNHRADCIAAAIVIVNCCPVYENPDAFAKGLVRPRFDMQKVVKDTVKIFAEIPLRSSADDPNDQPEALAVIVVNYDGKNAAKLVTDDLSPKPNSPIHYDTFLKTLCSLYMKRFGTRH
jgi:hypothetical protein